MPLVNYFGNFFRKKIYHSKLVEQEIRIKQLEDKISDLVASQKALIEELDHDVGVKPYLPMNSELAKSTEKTSQEEFIQEEMAGAKNQRKKSWTEKLGLVIPFSKVSSSRKVSPINFKNNKNSEEKNDIPSTAIRSASIEDQKNNYRQS